MYRQKIKDRAVGRIQSSQPTTHTQGKKSSTRFPTTVKQKGQRDRWDPVELFSGKELLHDRQQQCPQLANATVTNLS
jgi:hypothetical protein